MGGQNLIVLSTKIYFKQYYFFQQFMIFKQFNHHFVIVLAISGIFFCLFWTVLVPFLPVMAMLYFRNFSTILLNMKSPYCKNWILVEKSLNLFLAFSLIGRVKFVVVMLSKKVCVWLEVFCHHKLFFWKITCAWRS